MGDVRAQVQLVGRVLQHAAEADVVPGVVHSHESGRPAASSPTAPAPNTSGGEP